MPPESLERLIERLEHAAVTLRTGELPSERAAALVEECARLAAEAGAGAPRQASAPGRARPRRPGGGRGRCRARRGGAARARVLALGYPDHLRADIEAYLEGLRFSGEP